MTISTKVETAASAKAHGFHYVQSSNVAVVSVTGERDAPSTSLSTVLQACIARFEIFLLGWLRALPDDRLLLFAATPFWDQYNALSRRRGIWGSEGLSWLRGAAQRSPSVEISDGSGARFAGLVHIEQPAIFAAADFARTHGGSFLFVSPHDELTDERVRSMVKKVFPKGKSAVDWSAVVDQISKGEDIAIRVSGGFDDPEVSIDAFMRADLLRRLESPGLSPER